MKKKLMLILFTVLFSNVKGQAPISSYYIDFGKSNGTDGNITPGPDVNSNYWTNLTDPTVTAPSVFLTNSTGSVSNSVKINITSAFLSNGINTGGLLSPDPALLNDFAIATATQDYFYTNTNGKGEFKISGLSPTKRYVFKFFGSRDNTETRISNYKITGATVTNTSLKTSGVNISANGANNRNDNTIAVSDTLYANSNGEIIIELTKTAGTYGHLNIMKMEVYNTNSYYIDFGKNNGTDGNITLGPDVNNNYWTNLTDPTVTAPSVFLTNSTGSVSSSVKINITSAFLSNGINTGGLLSPNPALLNDFAIATATQDYFYTNTNGKGEFKISGLSATKRYVFKFFGSRDNTETRISNYKITGATVTNTSLKTSGINISANGANNRNDNTIAVSDTVYASSNGDIIIELTKTSGSYGHLNIMKMEVYNTTFIPKLTLTNEGFENGDLTGWTDENSNGILAVNNLNKHNGNFSFVESGDNAEISQSIDYLNGNNYRLTGYLYQSGMDKLVVGQAAHLKIAYFDKDNILLSMQKSDSLVYGGASDEWKKYTVGITVPVGTKFIKASLVWKGNASSAGSIRFDDISLEAYTPLDEFKIVYFGSSVPYGQGATNKIGYTSLYTNILNQRAITGGNNWTTSNISIPGDNTVKVLARYDSDLKPQYAKYVVFALSLGNEGIHENGQPSFDQFRTNLKQLIKQAREDGYVPVVTNSYTRNDFTSVDYNYVKQMNLLIQGWDVPSVNLLGAVDNLAGRYTDGYWDDSLHPNDAGHAELSHAIVPSLFDALNENKPIPKKVTGSFITVSKNTPNKFLNFQPEDIVHPFTSSISFKTANDGNLLLLNDADGLGKLEIINGNLSYLSSKGGNITGVINVKDNQWHKVTLTHYYAKGVTMLYCDSNLQGSVNEKLLLKKIKIGGPTVPFNLQLKDWLFYRSAMNADEVRYICRDSMLKSSLELFAPLDGKNISLSDSLKNLAQSTNVVTALVEAITSPTGMSLNNNTLLENNLLGATIGNFTTQDLSNDGFTYTLVNGTGDDDNGSFFISGNQLKANRSFDFEQKSNYSVRVRTTNSFEMSFEKSFTITINDQSEDYSSEPGNAFYFQGNDGVQALIDNPHLTNEPGPFDFSKGTVEAWILPDWDQNIRTADSYVFSMIDFWGTRWGISIDKNYGNVGIHTATNDYISYKFQKGHWYHLAAVFNDGGSIDIYVNGVKIGTSSSIVNSTITGTPFKIGISWSWSADQQFKGAIDEVRVWNVVLSEADIKANMNRPLSPNQTGLLAYYKFNENSGTVLNDASANAYNGNMIYWDNNAAVATTSPTWEESYAMVTPQRSPVTALNNNGFTLNWGVPVVGIADEYIIDVATDKDFTSFVTGYNNFQIGNQLSKTISGLETNKMYYYRVSDSKLSIGEKGNYSYSDSVYVDSTLPLDFKSFTLQKNNNSVQLNWIILNEKNNSYFNVLHSNDGLNWDTIGLIYTIDSKDENYFYKHESPSLEANYYKIQQVDFDGKFTYSEVRFTNFSLSPTDLKIYPNPFFQSITVQLSEESKEPLEYRVFNSIGNVVEQGKLNKRITVLQFDNFQKGVYIIKIDGYQPNKFIKE
ncbi:hypothetical protein I5M32_04760 [Pedobacter sp. SD-b]|uniref:Cadherin domain-containing protein n=1 Tax=Pedobacter segetis TaxID=2793069 RepID=A0ABS1BHA2_9SPHI|nr:LamG-like jellyroll fold domain-containing protein [Pedobacter segetis]MBK0382264.1 hypothetical protein [Pedobacter segetis]